jgi:endonuclease G, mitochondrial
MERTRQVQTDRRDLSLRAYERWKGFQPDLSKIRTAESNRDGTIPRPKVAEITPEQRARFEKRERLRETFDSPIYRELRVGMERKIGATLDFADLPPNEQALKAGRPVVRIVTLPGAGLVPQGFATAFLVAPDLILTNHHVFRTSDEAEGIGAQFLYERTQAGLREGLTFECDPKRFFINNKQLDYAVVALKTTAIGGAPLNQFKFLPLIAAKGKIRKGDPVNIIQHPSGDPKQYATVNNQLLDLRDDGFLLYETDTLEGSSGAPVFNHTWEVIGLHHCGVPRIEDGMLVTRDNRRLPLNAEVADDDLVWIANEGVRVSALVESFAAQRPDTLEQQQILKSLLDLTIDPLTLVAENSPIILGSTPIETNTMAQSIFNFTGPVTINVGNAAPREVIREGTILKDIAPSVTVTEFREKTLKFDENYKNRKDRGYKSDFLAAWLIPAPTVNQDHHGALLQDDAGKVMVIPYYHYSLVMNQDRRLVAWAASNVDYSAKARKFTKTRKQYGGENWRLDPRIALAAPGLQIEDADFYAPAKKIDRGHIVRREDSAWGGTAKEAEFGNSDTYHWTNCTPQSEAFNQSGLDGIWGQFEEHIQGEVKAMDGRMSVFAGPVLNPEDPTHGYANGSTIQVPMEFWKVVTCVSKENGASVRLAYGLVFDQTEPVQRLGYERMNMEDYEIYQVPIADITTKTGVVFDQSVLDADVLNGGGADESIRGYRGKRIKALENLILR